MSTIQEKIDRLRRYKGDMKEAINGRHSTVPVDENMAWYSTGIWGIPEGGGDDKDYINNPIINPYGRWSAFTTSDGTVFVGASLDDNQVAYDSGLYIIKDGVATKVEEVGNGASYYFFEASDGTIYIGAARGDDQGTWSYKDGVFTRLSGGCDGFFEASDGTIYMYGINSGAIWDGERHNMRDGSTFGPSDYYNMEPTHFFEASDGTIYATARFNKSYAYALKREPGKDYVTANKIIFKDSTGSTMTDNQAFNFFEASDGTVYVMAKEIWTINENYQGIRIPGFVHYSTLYWNTEYNVFEASDGTVYISIATYNNNYYIYAFKNGAYVTKYDYEPVASYHVNWNHFCELSDGQIIIGSDGNGVIALNNDGTTTKSVTVVFTAGKCKYLTPITYDDRIYLFVTGKEVGIMTKSRPINTTLWENYHRPTTGGTFDYVLPTPGSHNVICGSSVDMTGLFMCDGEYMWELHNSEQYNWMLYNDTWITTDKDHKYQYDDTDMWDPVKERTIELPESPKCFITIAKQNTYDV